MALPSQFERGWSNQRDGSTSQPTLSENSRGKQICASMQWSNTRWDRDGDIQDLAWMSPRGSLEAEVDVLTDSPDELDLDPEPDLEEHDTSGDSINVQGKVNCRRTLNNVLSQLVALTVVSSFTARNRHGFLITPVLLICKKRVRVCFYQCVDDILLLSEEVALMSSDGVVHPRGLFFIWIILHFR